MTSAEIRTLAIQGTEIYLRELDSKGKGWTEIAVLEKTELVRKPGIFRLKLEKRLIDAEQVIFRMKGEKEPFKTGDLTVVQYNAREATLLVKPADAIYSIFRNILEEELLIVADLRFLIQRVKTWFEKNGKSIRLPEKGGDLSIAPDLFFPDAMPSAVQMDAIRTVLSEPLTYIWGAPGTGKTKFVLAYSILNYLKAGRRIAILAPTNNAVEQVLRGVLPLTDRAAISRELILRLGTPSDSFAQSYPEVCEAKGLYKKIKEKLQEIKILEHELDLAKRKDELALLQGGLQLFARLLDLNSERDKWKRRIIELQEKGNELKGYEIDEMKSIQGKVDDDSPAEKLIAAIREVYEDEADAEPVLKELTAERWQINDVKESISNYLEEEEKSLEYAEEIAGNLMESDEEDIRLRIMQLEAEIKELEMQSTEFRMQSVQLAAMTLDSYIGRYMESELNVSHFFLDEAGYANLIKALTLFRAGIPVTLLGDHKQLPPVCEINDTDISQMEGKQDLFVWSQSAIHIGELFSEAKSDAWLRYKQNAEPGFRKMKCIRLTETHRFGPALAGVLNKVVYGNGFRSALSEGETAIYSLHVQFQTSAEGKRVNESEARVIHNLVMQMADEDFAVLTPYRGQVRKLSKLIPGLTAFNRLVTVHGSQGREWDTVILSIVDTEKMYFTDSNNTKSKGLNLINTAVSRARKRLIIVCDHDFWINQPFQLVSQLLQVARPVR